MCTMKEVLLSAVWITHVYSLSCLGLPLVDEHNSTEEDSVELAIHSVHEDDPTDKTTVTTQTTERGTYRVHAQKDSTDCTYIGSSACMHACMSSTRMDLLHVWCRIVLTPQLHSTNDP